MEPTLRLFLARYAVYNGWCYRHEQMWDDLTMQHKVDTTPRMLQRALLFVAGLGRFACVDAEWHALAYNSANKNFGTVGDTTELLELLSGFSVSESDEGFPKRLDNDAARGMMETMRVVRAAGRTLKPPLKRKRLDQLTYAVGEEVIKRAKKDYYRALWRKWWLTWRTYSRWLKALGEVQGAPGAPLGMAAIAAFDAEMGDAGRRLRFAA